MELDQPLPPATSKAAPTGRLEGLLCLAVGIALAYLLFFSVGDGTSWRSVGRVLAAWGPQLSAAFIAMALYVWYAAPTTVARMREGQFHQALLFGPKTFVVGTLTGLVVNLAVSFRELNGARDIGSFFLKPAFFLLLFGLGPAFLLGWGFGGLVERRHGGKPPEAAALHPHDSTSTP